MTMMLNDCCQSWLLLICVLFVTNLSVANDISLRETHLLPPATCQAPARVPRMMALPEADAA